MGAKRHHKEFAMAIAREPRPLARDLPREEGRASARRRAGETRSLIALCCLGGLDEPSAVSRARELIGDGAQLARAEIDNGWALCVALQMGRESVALEVMGGGPSEALERRYEGVTPLGWAARAGSFAVTRALLAAGARPHALGVESDDNPLAEAVAVERWDIAGELLGGGASWERLNPFGAPLAVEMAERARGIDDFAKLARQAQAMASLGADLNQRRKDGCSALHVIAREGYKGKGNWPGRKAAMEAFLGNGASANAQNLRGETPLGLAMQARGAAPSAGEAVALLLARGADPRIEDSDGVAPSSFQAPYDKSGRREVEAWLCAAEIARALALRRGEDGPASARARL